MRGIRNHSVSYPPFAPVAGRRHFPPVNTGSPVPPKAANSPLPWVRL